MLTKLNRKLNRFQEIARYLVTPRPSAFYIGWVGYRNLGDEAILEASEQAFSPVRMAYRRPLPILSLQALIDRRNHVGTLLGGGTQIGSQPVLEWFDYGLDRFGTGIVFGTGVRPVTGAEPPMWLCNWAKTLARCDYVGVRGDVSARTLAMVGIEAEVLGDTACLFAKPVGYWTPRKKTLGINIGQFKWGYGQEAKIIPTVAQFVRIMIARGWAIEFFCIWPPDLQIARDTARLAEIKQPVIHLHYERAEPYLGHLKNITVFVGMKLHSVVLAMCAGVPSVMMEYSPKCREFMDSVGMTEFNIRTDMLNAVELAGRVDQLEESGLTISKLITERVQAQRTRLMERATMLSALLLNRS